MPALPVQMKKQVVLVEDANAELDATMQKRSRP
jgi:hypothetical protein